MKKLLFLLIGLSAIISCNQSPTLYEKQQASLKTGIRVDTTMFSVCFNDAPDIVKQKLKESGHADLFGFCYQFPEARIHELEWKWDHTFAFHNDSLYQFSLHAETYDDPIGVLQEIFSAKYGEPFKDDDKLYWFKGNLEISIYFNDEYNMSHITYLNLNNYEHSVIEYDDDYNSYTIDYWNKHRKPEVDKAIDIAGEDI